MYGRVVKVLGEDGRVTAVNKLIEHGNNHAMQRAAQRELNTLMDLVPPRNGNDSRYNYIIEFLEFYTQQEDPPMTVIMMEYAKYNLSGLATVRDRIREIHIARIFYEMLLGLQYANEKGVMHRDLKPANILVTEYGVTKIGDWGLGKRIENGDRTHTLQVQTAWFRCPEIFQHINRDTIENYDLKCDYDFKCDMFSIGAMLAMLINMAEYSPFFTTGRTSWGGFDELIEAVRVAQFRYAWMNPDALELLRHTVDMNPITRWSVDEALQSEWFNTVRDGARHAGCMREMVPRIPGDGIHGT